MFERFKPQSRELSHLHQKEVKTNRKLLGEIVDRLGMEMAARALDEAEENLVPVLHHQKKT